MLELFVLGSICLIVWLVKGVYTNIEKPPNEPPPPPTLDEVLISILKHFKSHTTKMAVYNDRVVIYCFKSTPQDDVTDFNTITIRYCDIGFKAIIDDDLPELEGKLKSAILPQTDEQ